MSSLLGGWLRPFGLSCLLGLLVAGVSLAQDVDPEEAKEKAITDRFVVVLEKNPRRGTALDKVYGYHVERGSLENLISGYRQKAENAKGAEASSAWMIVGLLESLRGQDAVAVTAFEQAEKLSDSNYLASYYLGQSQVLIGQPDKAAEALERSIQRKPAQTDLLDIFQSLGRVYQRAQKADKALDVWNRLEKLFPNDARVQEQIATTLLEENEFAAALPRFEGLARTTKDRYRQSQFQIEAAELKVRLGRADEAIVEFEKLLDQLNPENWLHREVRRRIEGIYLRTDDQAGLIGYYEAWINKNPEDLEAVSRLSRLLAGLGRGPEAQAWLEKGLKLAPKKKELRNALINQLVYEQKYVEAIAQYEQLDKNEPNNPDTLRDWGRLILKDTARDEATRKKDAAAVWRRLTASKPKDPLIASQVGELFRQAEMVDDALELYKTAITLAPEQAQYREYLGEYYHTLKRKDEALATWREIADGKLKTAPNLARLAEVLSSFGYLAEAVQTNAEACKLDPKDFSLQLKQADLLSQAETHDASLAQLILLKKLAANDEEREAVLTRELRELQSLDQLKTRIIEMATEKDSKDPEHWFWLARAYESERQLKDASEAIAQASELAPQSVPILMASARIYEAQNNLLGAVEINTKLAAIDRRYRTEYLKQVAQLEQKLGRRDKAIQAGRDLIAAAPGNPELYEFFSALCFQLGETEEGLSALRRSVRVNPTEPKGLLLLASALGEQFRTGEAIELYWRAFDKAGNLEDRLGVVPKLTDLYLQTNQLDRLLERLERQRREPNQQREMTICLAQAYQSAGDDGNARQELEKLLTEDTRDVQLLTQLVKLCETDGDIDAAVKFQQQLLKASPGKESTMRLAQLLMKSGETDEANELMSRVTLDEKDPETVMKSLDSMLNQENFVQALAILQKLTRDQPRNWELLYREGVALAKSKEKEKHEEARARFESILAMKLNDDDQSLATKNQSKKQQARLRSPVAQMRQMNPMMQRSQYTWQIRQAVGLDNQNYGGQQQAFWPIDFGTARMSCLGWLDVLARNEGKEDEFLAERRKVGENAENERALIDWYYLAALTNQSRDVYSILKKLSKRPDADSAVKSMYLNSLSARGVEPGLEVAEVDPPVEGEEADANQSQQPKLSALSQEDMEHVMACFKSMDDSTAVTNFGQSFLQTVAAELKRCGRREEAEKLLKDAIANAKDAVQIAILLPGVVASNDYETALKLLDRLSELKDDSSASQGNPNSQVFSWAQYVMSPDYQSQILAQLMGKRAQKKSIKDTIELWDRYLISAVKRYEHQKTPAEIAKKKSQQRLNPYQQQRGYVYVWRGNNQQYENLDFPSANDVYDQPTIQMLRQAFVNYREADAVKDLLAHFQQKVADPSLTETQKLFWQFGLGYLHWWLDEKDEALAVLTAATERIPDSTEMKFELAQLHERRGEHEQALAIVDSLSAADQQILQRREITALRMAVNSGNIERARTAAERLFGLRLDSNLQIQLARQMHQLGMHEQAESVLSRAGRQAGNRTDVLANLMQQYQSQGKNDVATQIAHQLLRRSVNNSSSTMAAIGRRRSVNSGDNGTRIQALTILKRSGKLPEMIKKVEGQLKSSPKSQRLIETLIEYYTANGDTGKVEEMTAKIAETKQDDPVFRYNLGQQLMQQGKHKEAVEHFKVAIKKDPRLMRNNFYEIINSFQSADKLNDLATVLDEMDLKTFRQNPWELTNMISNMSYQEKTKERAVALFKRAWKDLPDQRQQLLSNLNNDAFWQMPEIYDYARQGIIPTETSILQNSGWQGFGQIQSWGGDGKITTLMSRFLTIAASNQKLDQLTQEVQEAQAKVKQWQGAKALLALIQLRQGKVDEAKAVFEQLLPSLKGVQQGQYTRWEIGQELMAHDQCVDLAIRYFESACSDPDLMNQNGFQYSPGKPLVALYRKQGRKDDARRIMVEASKLKSSRYRGNEDYEAYQRINNSTSLGAQMREMGYPIDALRVYQDQLARTEDFNAAIRVYGGGTNGSTQIDRMKKQLETGFQAALKELKPEFLPELLAGPSKDAADKTSSVDLLLMFESRDLDQIRMNSALSRLVSSLSSNPDMVEKTKAALAEIRSTHPNDITALILVAQLSVALKDDENLALVVRQLVSLIEETPLEPQPEKGSFTARQREDAKQQIGLWLVARDCLKNDSHREAGARLGERSLEAARRQTDHGYELAILREWGQLNIDGGDRDAALKRWSAMLDVVIPKPVEKTKKAEDQKTSSRRSGPVQQGRTEPHEALRPVASQETIQVVSRHPGRSRFAEESVVTGIALSHGSGPHTSTVAPVARSTAGWSRWHLMLAPVITTQLSIISVSSPQPVAASSGRVGAITIAQFEQATQIARLAAEHGLQELSIQAMTEALQPGPPIDGNLTLDPNQPLGTTRNVQQADHNPSDLKVEELLTAIERLWRQKGFSDEVVYEMLRNAVLPERRPFEVFLYQRPLSLTRHEAPQSIGTLLIHAAIKAKKIDEIKSLLEPRLKQPLGELSSRVLLAQLAIAADDSTLAIEQLELLNKRLQQDTLQTSSELACHAAIPALADAKLAPLGRGLLERAVDQFSQNAVQARGNVQEEPMRTLRFRLARLHFAEKDYEGGKKHLEEYLNFLTPLYARYSGDYGQYRRRSELMKIAAEYALAGQGNDLLDCLGRFADLPVNRNYGQEAAGRATATILSGIASLPAADRYALLKSWSLPTPERNSIRMIGELVPGDTTPVAFDSLRGSAPRGPRSTQIMSTANLLVDAAAEVQQLAELQQTLEPLAEQNVENAGLLLMLTRLANGKSADAVAALQKAIDERKAGAASTVRGPNLLHINDLIIARAATSDPQVSDMGRELAQYVVNQALNTRDTGLLSLARREAFSPFNGRDAADRIADQPWNPGLKLWTSAMNAPAAVEAGGAQAALWVAHEGLLSHICGPDNSQLYLKYPLTGEFTVTVDSWVGRFAESAIGYGGVIYNGLHLSTTADATTLGNRVDTVQKPPLPMVRDQYNRARLEITKDKTRYFVNDLLVFEEPLTTRTSPFFFIYGSREWTSAMANLRITGNPVIPRQVALVQDDSLLGWVSEFYGEQRPNRDPHRVVEAPADQPAAPKVTQFDWSAQDGILSGRFQPAATLGHPGVRQSRIYYDRPLLSGERIQYEFWYEPGSPAVTVAPALDRLAFLFDEQKVRLHWMTDGNSPEDAYGGLAPDNLLTDPSVQRGPVKLVERDWNAVEIAMGDESVTISLNGTVVAERTLERNNRRQFGFYHDKYSTSARIRNVVLTGNWPETIAPEVWSDLLAPSQPRTQADRIAFSKSIEEKFHANGLTSFLQQTRALPLENQYQRLKDWVVPNDDHAVWRLYGDFTADTSLPTELTALGTAPQPTIRRQKLGGELIAPAIELVDAARQLNRLDDLSESVAAATATTPVAIRSKLALQVLINAAKGDTAQATALIAQLLEQTRAIPEDVPLIDRWPEMVVGSEITRSPELRGAVMPLLIQLVEHQHKKGLGESWEGRVTGLRDRCKVLLERSEFPLAGGSSPKGEWISASLETADAHGRGPVSRWLFDDQGVAHLAGCSLDYLYFQSPLRGSFTVEADVATHGWRETRLLYNALWVGPQHTKTVVELGTLTTSWTGPKIEPNLEFGDWCRMKLVVAPGKATWFLNDRQVHELPLPEQPDPWLALTTWGNSSGGARMVRISGQPEIPESLDLSAGNSLNGWMANLYQDPLPNPQNNADTSTGAWIKEGGEILGRKFEPTPGRKRQSVLRYHRPLVEDAVVTYDFFYIPDQTIVHPSVGRVAFLMEPEGVKEHWLTDSVWERSTLPPDNSSVIAEHRRGPDKLPFKLENWNRLQLRIKEDTLTLVLNDVEIYEAPLALTNQRQFGLFHFADESEVRVRNIVYQGNWPRTLPALQDQELAQLGNKPYDFAPGELVSVVEWDFQNTAPAFLKPIGNAGPNSMQAVDGGLKVSRGENAAPEMIRCGFEWVSDVKGDFELTLEYRDFQSKTEQPDWQIPRIEMFLDIGGPWNTPENTHQMMTGIRRHSNQVLIAYSGNGTHLADKYDWKYTTDEANAPSGRFRLVRKGEKGYYLFAKGDSDDWMLINSGLIGKAPLAGGNFSLRAEMATSSGEAVFTRFSLKSRDPKSLATVTQP